MLRIDSIRRRNQRGQSLIETALMMIVIFTIVFWIFELSWLFYTYSVMADAANEGVRYGIVHSAATQSTAKTAIENQVKTFAATSLHNVSGMTVTVTWPDTDGSGAALSTAPHTLRVSISYPYIPFLPEFISSPTMNTYAEGNMVVN